MREREEDFFGTALDSLVARVGDVSICTPKGPQAGCEEERREADVVERRWRTMGTREGMERAQHDLLQAAFDEAFAASALEAFHSALCSEQ